MRYEPGRLLRCALVALAGAGFAGCSPDAHALKADKPFHQYVQDRWGLEAGLPQISVNAIAQDARGYIWLGTQTGLARFDGQRFTTFVPDTAPGLPGAWIRVLRADAKGRLWVGTYQGLALREGNAFRALAPTDGAVLDVRDIAFADDGSVWVASPQGVYRLRDARLEPVDAVREAAWALAIDADALWIGVTGAVLRHDARGWQRRALPASLADAKVSAIARVNGRLWVGSRRGLLFDAGRGWQRPAHAPPALLRDMVTFVQPDADGNLWVGSEHGLARLHADRVVEWIDAATRGTVHDPLSAFEDREGNFWIGSQSDGLVRLWSGWSRRFSTADGLHVPIVWSLAPASGDGMYVGTHDGVALLQEGHFRKLVEGTKLPHPQAYNLLAEPDRLWIGTRQGLVWWQRGKVHTDPAFAPIANAQINALVRDRDGGDLWIGSSAGLYRWNGTALMQVPADSAPVGAGIRYLLQCRDGTWLAAGVGGVWQSDGARLYPLRATPALPPGTDITSLHELPGNRIVAGALSEETWILDHGGWRALGPAQGMPANVHFMMSEHDGWLWLAGIRGVQRVPLADIEAWLAGNRASVRGEVVLNERGDLRGGQQASCCNGAGNAKGLWADGALWLPSVDGVVQLRPEEVLANPVPPGVDIESVRFNGSWLPLAGGQRFTLPLGERDLTVAFAALSFRDVRTTRVEYRLHGEDADWRTLPDGAAREATYTNLGPGRYRFAVRATNVAGVRSAQPAMVDLLVPPRWYETTLARVLAVLVLALALFPLLLWLSRRHRRREAQLQRLVDARTAELTALNHKLREASQTDPLTGLRNRRFLDNQMPADIGFYQRELAALARADEVVVFALIDVDHFKQINDRHGHHQGDEVLRQLAQLLGMLLRAGDYLVRWGGEEFVIVLRPIASAAVPAFAERIRQAVAAHRFTLGDGQELALTVSIGLAEFPFVRGGGGPDWAAMVELADRAMYWVKQHGRNDWALLRATEATRGSDLIARLRADAAALLDSGELRLLRGRGDAAG